MSKTVLTNFAAVPDVGELKREKGEYANLQNVRGWGGFGAKRRGVQNFPRALDSGIMGMFDLKIDGEPLSPDKILVVTQGGDYVLYDFTELISVFDFLFDAGVALYLQSPNLGWWDITPTTGDAGGLINPLGVAAPSSSISADLSVDVNQLFGFEDSTGIWRMYVDTSNPVVPSLSTKRYSTASSITGYTSTVAFATGVGPCFQTTDLQRWRLTIDNSGILTLTSI